MIEIALLVKRGKRTRERGARYPLVLDERGFNVERLEWTDIRFGGLVVGFRVYGLYGEPVEGPIAPWRFVVPGDSVAIAPASLRLEPPS